MASTRADPVIKKGGELPSSSFFPDRQRGLREYGG